MEFIPKPSSPYVYMESWSQYPILLHYISHKVHDFNQSEPLILIMAAVSHHRNKLDEPGMQTESALSSRQRSTGNVLTASAIGTTLLILSGLTLTGTVMALIMATPVLVVFSPILVPAGIVMFLAASGLVFSGGCGLAAVTALSWLYRYVSNYVAAKKRNQAYGQFKMLGV